MVSKNIRLILEQPEEKEWNVPKVFFKCGIRDNGLPNVIKCDSINTIIHVDKKQRQSIAVAWDIVGTIIVAQKGLSTSKKWKKLVQNDYYEYFEWGRGRRTKVRYFFGD